MAGSDADRWNERYRQSAPPNAIEPHEIVTTFLGNLHENALVADVACGWGDNGLFLGAKAGHTTFIDVSSVALDAVAKRAKEMGIDADAIEVDLAAERFPPGAWDAITCTHYLDRELITDLVSAVRPGGMLAIAIATTTNLERHERPSKRFLLKPGELPELASVRPECLFHYDEAWRSNGVHEAWLVVKGYEETRGVVFPPPVKATNNIPLITEYGDDALGENHQREVFNLLIEFD